MVYKNLATNSAFKRPPSLPRGGILADDMGLGKTITAIALMLAAPASKEGKNLVVPARHVGFGFALCL